MNRTYKYRLYPTVLQRETLARVKNYCCDLYNAALAERRFAYKQAGVSVSYNQQSAQLKEIDRPEGVSFAVCQQVLRRVDKAFQNFFRRLKQKGKAGYPRFRKRHSFKSFEYPKHGNLDQLRETKRLTIPGVGKVKIRLRNQFSGHYKSVVVKEELGKWCAHFRVEVPEQAPLPPTGEEAGIDVGLYHFAALDGGERLEVPSYLRSSLKELRRKQRRLSRCERGGNTRRKVRRQVARLHQKVRNQRRDFTHKLAKRLVAQYDTVYLEDLNIKNMVKNRRLSLSISDAAWGLLTQFISYKAESAGRRVIRVSSQNTSQVCPQCGSPAPKTLRDRWHCCGECGLSCDRDVAAAREIKRRGQRLVGITWPDGASVPAEV